MRPLKARISLAALRGNLALARERAGAARVCAIIKANAYGHGVRRVLPALEAADALGLLELDAALELREAGERRPIVLLEGFFTPGELPLIASQRLTPVVHALEQVAMLERADGRFPMAVFLKLNTGMNRLGLDERDFAAALRRLQACAAVGEITLMTHFATADGRRGIGRQLQRFRAAAGGTNLPGSLANSAALLRFPETHGQWVRPGIMLYGCSPFADESAQALGLKPVMTLASEVIAIRELAPRERLGYGLSYAAPGAMRVGVVACGYADGYPRHAPTGTPIHVAGKRTRTVGRVSMDMLFADLTGIPGASVGSPVILWGDPVSADEVAASAGTLSYELLAGLGSRVPVAVVDAPS